MVNSNYMVSVCMITYNQQAFIEDAIKGVLKQQSEFPIEFVISNDKSTDRTSKIIKSCTKKLPSNISLSFYDHDKNLGMIPNFVFALQHCKGKYIALCEGDDYWTDPLKLQKQVDFLEAHEDYGICFHKVIEKNTFNNQDNIIPKKNINSLDIEDYIVANYTATCSMVFKKKKFYEEVPHWFSDLPFGDLGLILTILKNTNGKAKVLDDVMGVYRIHSGGIHGSYHKDKDKLIKAYLQHLQFFNIVKKYLLNEPKFHKPIISKYLSVYKTLMNLSTHNKTQFYKYKFYYYLYRLRLKSNL